MDNQIKYQVIYNQKNSSYTDLADLLVVPTRY